MIDTRRSFVDNIPDNCVVFGIGSVETKKQFKAHVHHSWQNKLWINSSHARIRKFGMLEVLSVDEYHLFVCGNNSIIAYEYEGNLLYSSKKRKLITICGHDRNANIFYDNGVFEYENYYVK